MTPLEKLFYLEIEFHRRLRAHAPNTADATALHTCYALRDAFFGRKWGWLRLWMVLVGVGILGTPGPAAGSLEGMIYTRIPPWVQLRGLPEVLLQTAAFSWLLCHWVDHPEKRWLSWCLGVAFAVVCLLPAVGLLARRG